MAKLTVNDLDVRGKRVFVRVDYNVPMAEQDGQMVINDDTRIRATIPTLDLLIKGGARIILAAHLGRPNGQVEPTLSLKPVAAKLADMIGRPIAFKMRLSPDCRGICRWRHNLASCQNFSKAESKSQGSIEDKRKRSKPP